MCWQFVLNKWLTWCDNSGYYSTGTVHYNRPVRARPNHNLGCAASSLSIRVQRVTAAISFAFDS